MGAMDGMDGAGLGLAQCDAFHLFQVLYACWNGFEWVHYMERMGLALGWHFTIHSNLYIYPSIPDHSEMHGMDGID